MTDAIAPYLRKHPRNCVRRASGLVLTQHSEKAAAERARTGTINLLGFANPLWVLSAN